MQKIQTAESCVLQFKPNLNYVIYRTSVEVIGKHISGLLLFKQMPDSSTRIVFYNEMGFTFFDFGFGKDNSFTVYQIFPEINKKALIKTLRRDFELIIFRNMENRHFSAIAEGGLIYHAYPQTKGVNYYITDSNCRRLVKMQRATRKKPIVEAVMNGKNPASSPDTISIRHLNFDFSISLKKISTLAAQ